MKIDIKYKKSSKVTIVSGQTNEKTPEKVPFLTWHGFCFIYKCKGNLKIKERG